MRIGVIGISFKTASLEVREKFASVCESFATESSLWAHSSLTGSCIVLNTCNRSEIYFTSDILAKAHSSILSYIRRFISVDFDHLLYSYFGFDCFLHLAKVTSGIDSAVLGETEIQGQVKKSYEKSRENSLLCKEMHYLFQKSLMIGKNIRFNLLHNGEKPSFERMFWDEVFAKLTNDASILFVGASQVNSKLLKFKPKSLNVRCFHTNRTEENGRAFVDSVPGLTWVPWKSLNQLMRYESIVVGTSSHQHLINEEHIDKESSKSLLLFDLSLPRNINPKISDYPNVSLANIDDLHKKVMSIQETHETSLLSAHQAVVLDVRRKFSIFHSKQKRLPFPILTEVSN